MGPLEQMLTGPQEKEREQKKKMQLMLRNSRRLLGLINQLLELSKFDSGTMKLQAARQNIVPFLKGVLHSFDSLAVQKEVELIFKTEAEDIPLYYDPGKMEEVITNLLSNAVKFTPAGGRITLAVKVKKALSGMEEQEYLEVSVSDTGPGLPREEIAHIFDRFYQADSTYEHHRQGNHPTPPRGYRSDLSPGRNHGSPVCDSAAHGQGPSQTRRNRGINSCPEEISGAGPGC
ncbi:MAG: hypothetical protein JSV88_18930 [Candidatus Aminicenantes bacterium]|nr:MAG: hypothetical protein JSV88_18930 [Candidatus Aminicenantes bacterium]